MRFLCAVFALLSLPSAAGADDWSLPPAGYGYAAIARCGNAAAATLKPNEARYEICADQMALLAVAVEKARLEKRLLIVDFGATWCPWCKSLQAEWRTAKLIGGADKRLDLGATFDVLEIGLSTLQEGRMTDIPSGHAVLDHVLAATKGTKLKSIPFLAVLDPGDRKKTVARSLDDFEQPNSGKHDPSQIRTFLVETHAYMRSGAAAPSEPGWLRKKIRRAWMRVISD